MIFGKFFWSVRFWSDKSFTAPLSTLCGNTQKSQNRGLIPTIHPETNFSRTCSFGEVLDNVELITYMKFQKSLVMTECRIMCNKHQKYTKNEVLHHLCPPKNFFQKSGCQFCTLIVPNFMQTIRKIQWIVPKKFKDRLTDGLTDGRTEVMT